MGLYTENVSLKANKKDSTFMLVGCICGSKSVESTVAKDDWDEYTWLKIECKRCGKTLFYNGA